jgi:aminoglycoside phosphotransferase (APT) family kinase protein
MDDTATALLDVLRRKLDRPGLNYAEPPVALRGGFWAEILAVRLSGAPPDLSGPLVARVMPAGDEASAREMVVQREVALLGFPAPAVRLTGDATDGLGRPYMLMDRVPGAPLLSGITAAKTVVSIPRVAWRLPRLLASTALQLHLLDVAPIRAAVDREVPGGSVDAADVVSWFGHEAERHGDPLLISATRWLSSHQPEPERVCLCHGDLHPFNLLVAPGGAVSLIDWTASTISEPAFDLAFTLLTFKGAPIDVPARARPPLRRAAAWVADRVLATYRALAAPYGIVVDDERMAWHTALHCTRVLLEVEEMRASGERPGHPFIAMAGDVRAELTRITALAPA